MHNAIVCVMCHVQVVSDTRCGCLVDDWWHAHVHNTSVIECHGPCTWWCVDVDQHVIHSYGL